VFRRIPRRPRSLRAARGVIIGFVVGGLFDILLFIIMSLRLI
jgi:hypothetical protein